MLTDRTRPPRTLYIIGTSLFQCHRTATEWGLDPKTMLHTRCITKAYDLRGVTAGTPFIAYGREFWPHSEAGYDLDQAVTAYQRIGRLRIAQEDDLAACRPFDGLPSQDRPSGERRAAL